MAESCHVHGIVDSPGAFDFDDCPHSFSVNKVRTHREVNAAMASAERERRCITGTTAAMQQALRRRRQSGELVSPYRNLYAPSEYWQGLDDCERSLHVARGLAHLHPTWTFAGLTAADAHGLDHSWRLHANREVWLMNTACRSWPIRRGAADQPGRYTLRHVPMRPHPEVREAGLRVTSLARTLVDCGLHLDFCDALALFDAAARRGEDFRDVLQLCAGLHADVNPVRTLIRYADSRSENGGESAVRAQIIIYGFALPELQVVFNDPSYPGRQYRVDFLWRLHDGRVIVLEYDGMAKYREPSMTDRRTVKAVLNDRAERDRALLAAGVTTILHCTYEDALVTGTMYHELRKAGVPLIRRMNAY